MYNNQTYDSLLNKIITAASTSDRDAMLKALRDITAKEPSAMAPVLAMGALCFGHANTTYRFSEAELTALKDWSALARERAAKANQTSEAQIAEAAADLFALVARRQAGDRTSANRDVVLAARAKIAKAAATDRLDFFEVLNAAALRFFPASLRDRTGKADGINRLTASTRASGATGTLARLLFADHLARRKEGRQLAMLAQQIEKELPGASCGQIFKAVAARSSGNTEAAESFFQAAHQKAPSNDAVRQAYAAALRANGKVEKAQALEKSR
jgi:hypothetical protein